MRALVGTILNIVWWRLNTMSDKEIEEFNRKHLVEVEMTPIKKQSEVIARNEREHDRMWNAAINAAQAELAAKFVAPEIVVEIIGKLKK